MADSYIEMYEDGTFTWTFDRDTAEELLRVLDKSVGWGYETTVLANNLGVSE